MQHLDREKIIRYKKVGRVKEAGFTQVNVNEFCRICVNKDVLNMSVSQANDVTN